MDPFYTIVVVIAIVVLILCLIAVGIMLQKQDDTTPFPSQSNQCPDGWGVSENGYCIVPTLSINKGTTSTNSALMNSALWTADPNNTNHYIAKDSATICDKRKWAIQNNIIWDGISNYNQCK